MTQVPHPCTALPPSVAGVLFGVLENCDQSCKKNERVEKERVTSPFIESTSESTHDNYQLWRKTVTCPKANPFIYDSLGDGSSVDSRVHLDGNQRRFIRNCWIYLECPMMSLQESMICSWRSLPFSLCQKNALENFDSFFMETYLFN